MSAYTETHTVGNTDYTFITRLRGYQLDKIPQKQRIVFLVDVDNTDTEALHAGLEGGKMPLEILPNESYGEQLLALFITALEIEGRVVNATPQRLRAIPPEHWRALVGIAESYLAAQNAELAEFDSANPTMSA